MLHLPMHYAANRRNEMVANGADPAGVDRYYPDASLVREWIAEVEREAAHRGRQPDAVLDAYRELCGDVQTALTFRGVSYQSGWPGYATLSAQAQLNLVGASHR